MRLRHVCVLMMMSLPAASCTKVTTQSALNSDFRHYKPAHAVSTMWNPWEREN